MGRQSVTEGDLGATWSLDSINRDYIPSFDESAAQGMFGLNGNDGCLVLNACVGWCVIRPFAMPEER
jgi:hypothetical protein